MEKYRYTVTIGTRNVARFVNQTDAEFFVDSLHEALEKHETIKIETQNEIVYKIREVN